MDLQTIYKNQVKPAELFDQLEQILDSIESKYADSALLRTRKDNNKILSYSDTKYFTFVERSDKRKPDTIFAGALENSPRGGKAPVIRVRNGNTFLSKIPDSFKFPFEGQRNPPWTNIIIAVDIIETLTEALHSEVANYFKAIQR